MTWRGRAHNIWAAPGRPVNIYLIPYTAWRHTVVALVLAATGLICWWVAQLVVVWMPAFTYGTLGFVWSQRFDGILFLGTLVGGVAFGSLAAEGALHRRPIGDRVGWGGVAAVIAVVGMWCFNGLFALILPLFTSEGTDTLLADASFVSFRYHLFAWLSAGGWAGFGAFWARRIRAGALRRFSKAQSDGTARLPWADWLQVAFAHVGGGLVAGAFGGACWHALGHYDQLGGDLYVASAVASGVFGGLHGLLCWGVPDELYAGWIRVLSAERYGLRVPVFEPDQAPAERFVGHFPRGLDLYLPADRGVAEMHVSFVRDEDGRYTVRGLTQQPTQVVRLLERVDLSYDPVRPSPLETALRMEDRVLLGEAQQTVVEFLMLPREEQ